MPAADTVGSLKTKCDRTLQELRRVIIGQDDAMRWMLVATILRGHALLEGVPGTAKTLLVRALARALGCEFRRIQFTPDLMPSDIVGTNVFDLSKSLFTLRKGPIFTDLLLADEINRTPAKTQAALLEAMQERQATIDGVTHPISPLFTVFATQNPVEFEGTYPLPEAQVDRFMFKIILPYPRPEDESEILKAYNAGLDLHDIEKRGVHPIWTPEEVLAAKPVVDAVKVSGPLLDYIRRVVSATRDAAEVLLGCGPRASIHLLQAGKALAALGSRDFLLPDDVKEAALPVLQHRLILTPEAEVDGVKPADILSRLLGKVEVPR